MQPSNSSAASVRELIARGEIVAAAYREADACDRDGYDVTAVLLRRLALQIDGFAAEIADLKRAARLPEVRPMTDQQNGASIGHWLAVEFALREVMDADEAVAGACELKDLGFQVTAPKELYEAALAQEAGGDGEQLLVSAARDFVNAYKDDGVGWNELDAWLDTLAHALEAYLDGK